MSTADSRTGGGEGHSKGAAVDGRHYYRRAEGTIKAPPSSDESRTGEGEGANGAAVDGRQYDRRGEGD